MKRKLILLLLFLLLPVVIISCTNSSNKTNNKPVEFKALDKSKEVTIKSVLRNTPELSNCNIQVKVDYNNIYLNGEVKNEEQKELAEKLTRKSLQNVKIKIINNLQINP